MLKSLYCLVFLFFLLVFHLVLCKSVTFNAILNNNNIPSTSLIQLTVISFINIFSSIIFCYLGYGLSETSPVVTIVAPRKPKTLGSVGEVVSNTSIRVIDINDPTATHLGPNKVGEIIVRGPQVMKGYHNRPEETANSFIDGYFRTGDIGYYTDKKHFFITERIKELIKVKGFQVAPAELEEIIRGFDGVGDCAVIGVPHEYHGEVPRAYIVPKAQTKIDCEKLNDYVASKVAQYKQLKGGIAVIDSIPKNASGKILRRQLKLQFAEEHK